MFPKVRDYLRGQDDIEADTMCSLSNYWQLLSQRASGLPSQEMSKTSSFHQNWPDVAIRVQPPRQAAHKRPLDERVHKEPSQLQVKAPAPAPAPAPV